MVQAHERKVLSSAASWLPKFLMPGFFLDVAAELEAHRGQYLGGEIVFAARRKPLK
jgi:hypothetical protein